MLRSALVLALLALSLPVRADEHKLTGAEIRQALTGHTVKGDGGNGAWAQDFEPAGRTVYSQGVSNSPGLWQVKGDQYCSSWPPNPNLSCYDVLQDGDGIVFVSNGGGRTVGRLAK